jgi:hypothetical protein
MAKILHGLGASIVCFFLLCLTGAASISPEIGSDLIKGRQLVVKIPARLLKYETDSIASGAPIFTAQVSVSGETIAVEGDSDWRMRGWPMMITLYYEKSVKKKEYTEVECRSGLAYVKLRFSPDTPDVNAALRRLLYFGSVETFESSEEFKSLADKLLPIIFTGALGQIARDKQLQLMKELSYNDKGFGVEEFKGKQYIAFSAPDTATIFNSLKVKQAARVATALKAFVIPGLDKVAPFITDANDISGIKVRTRIFHKNFHSKKNPRLQAEILEIFAPYDLVERFYNQEITRQKLVDGSFIFVDGAGIGVDLSQAARF